MYITSTRHKRITINCLHEDNCKQLSSTNQIVLKEYKSSQRNRAPLPKRKDKTCITEGYQLTKLSMAAKSVF